MMKRRYESRYFEGDLLRKRRWIKEEVLDSFGLSDVECDGEKWLKVKKIVLGGCFFVGLYECWRDSGRKGDRKGYERK